MSYIHSVTVYPSSATITKGQWYYEAYASISSDCPECAEVKWYSNDSSIASVNETTGYIYGVNTGETKIYAEATDGSGKKGYITVTVTAPVSVTGVDLCPTSLTMNVGDIEYLCASISPSNATNQTVTWCSSDESVAEVNTYSGKVTAKKPGTTTITATTADGGYSASCTIEVGCSAVVNGRRITVFGEDDELLDSFEGQQITGLHVFANDMLLTTAREECDGDITVCMGEVAQALCTDYHLNPDCTQWYVSTSHKDLQVFREKTYYTSELGLCPFDNVNDRISLSTFVEDMGYSSKYSSISYANGAKVIIIQGHDWYSAVNFSAISGAEVASLTLSCLPYIGDAKDFVEGVTGKDVITGETLSPLDRVLCIGCTFVPVLNGVSIRVGRKGLAKIDNVVDYIDDLSDAQKVVLHSDIWDVLRPTTRGLCIEAEYAHSVYKLSNGWYHVGKEMNGFFPVIDFVKHAEKIEDTLVVSMKTLDPRLYKLADGSYNSTKIKNVINAYTDKLRVSRILIDDVSISKRGLDLVVPKGYADVVNNIEELNEEGIIFKVLEV